MLGVFPAFAWLNGPRAQLFAIAATWFITGLNYLGMKKAGDFHVGVLAGWERHLLGAIPIVHATAAQQGAIDPGQKKVCSHSATYGLCTRLPEADEYTESVLACVSANSLHVVCWRVRAMTHAEVTVGIAIAVNRDNKDCLTHQLNA